MNRIDRLTAILIQLQSKRIVKANEIAQRFDISLRTVYRDIRALNEAGVPIGSEAGIGYYMVKGYHLPPMMLTKEEAGSLLMAEKLTETFADQSIVKHHNAALFKIKSVLKYSEKDYLDTLETGISIGPHFNIPKETGEYQAEIQQAIVERRVINIKYKSLKEETLDREVLPIGIYFYGSAWHLIGYCKLREGYRDFRTNRIISFHLSNEHFKSTDLLSLSEYIDEITKNNELEEVVIEIDNYYYSYMVNLKYFLGFVKDNPGEKYTEVTFLTSDIDYFARNMLTFGKSIKIKSSDKLKDIMTTLVSELKDHYLT